MALRDMINKYVIPLDDKKEEPKKDAAPTGRQPAGFGGSNSSPPFRQPLSPPAAPDNEFVPILRAKMRARNTAFSALLAASDKMARIPDPNLRLQAAFDMISGEGRGVKEIMAAIEVHASDLENEKGAFVATLQREQTAAVGSMQRDVDSLNAQEIQGNKDIDILQQQIVVIQDRMASGAVRRTDLTSQIREATRHFQESQQKFETALGLVKSELESQKAVISAALS